MFSFRQQSILLSFFIGLYSNFALADDEDSDSFEAASTQLEATVPSGVTNYHFEFMADISYKSFSGSLNRVNEEPADFVESGPSASLGVGFLMGDHFEPVVEYSLQNVERTIGEFKTSAKVSTWGAGFIFNIPFGDDSLSFNDPRNAPQFSTATWIPYGGFIITNQNTTRNDDEGTGTAILDDGQHSYILMGLRYMMYDHIGINMWVRADLDKTTSEVTTATTSGGALSRTSLIANVFSFTILI